jgi:hypothetical protein
VKRSQKKTYIFRCAQAENTAKPEKVDRPHKKQRTTRRMKRFPCKGRLAISIDPDHTDVTTRMRHAHAHVAYNNIGLPDHWKEFISKHSGLMTPGQVSYVSFITQNH